MAARGGVGGQYRGRSRGTGRRSPRGGVGDEERSGTYGGGARARGRGLGFRSNFKKFPTHTQDHGDA